ncbi:MAG: efflux RND transporter periplasmic adaptor subunit, partial [Patescibacteria group bacterium]
MKFWSVLKLKKIWIPLLIIILIVAGVMYSRAQNNKPQYKTETVQQQDLKQTVSVTGTVEAAEAVDLNFKITGRVSSMPVKVGDKVKHGDRLAVLESSDAQAALLTAQAQVQQYEAALAKIEAGSSTEDIEVYKAAVAATETTLDNAKQSLANTKASQTQAVTNAWAQLVGLAATAVPDKSNISTVTITVSGTYNGSEVGVYTIRFDNPVNSTYSIYGLETIHNIEGSRSTSTPLGSYGLKIQFSSTGTFVAGDTWTVEIPNTSSTSYSTYYAAYQAALTTQTQQVEAAESTVKSAEQSLLKAQADLALKQAPARSYDIASAQAQLNVARASLIKAQADLADRTIKAPVAGIATKVNYQVGETTSLANPIVVLQTEGGYQIKVKVPESDIVKLVIGQTTDITLDALGSSEHFSGHISFINPAETPVSDVIYYEVTIMFDNQDERIKPGMTANIDVLTADKKNVLVAPLRAVK